MKSYIFTIGDIARLAGITPKTIRHYHKVGLLSEPARGQNNYRLYSVDQLETLQRIQHMKRLGLSLYQIRQILDADDPTMLAQTILLKQQDYLQEQIRALSQQLDDIQLYLNTDTSLLQPIQTNSPKHSAMKIVSASMKSSASGAADMLCAVEERALAKVDGYMWTEGYDQFWHEVGQVLGNIILREESQFIFWMERYLALGEMAEDDLQGLVWIQEIQQSRERLLIKRVFKPHLSAALPATEQEQIQKLIPVLLYQEASPLQKAFLRMLITL
ncbi:MAG: MerR family transcriptional regulator [Chloroflexota bacterium]|nr:MerR family transcriptional regulator [Chloroflexota bacterium]